MQQEDIKKLETEGKFVFDINGNSVEIGLEDVEISTEDIPGWSVASMDNLTVALDITITPDLQNEAHTLDFPNLGCRKPQGLAPERNAAFGRCRPTLSRSARGKRWPLRQGNVFRRTARQKASSATRRGAPHRRYAH